MMSPKEIWILLMTAIGGLAILIPIIGITARIALKPIAEAIARVREAGQGAEAVRMIERRMSLLEQELQSLGSMREDVARIAEAQEFHLRLAAPRDRTAGSDA